MNKTSSFLLFLLLTIGIGLTNCDPNRSLLYKSKEFSLYPNKIVQGEFEATAIDSCTILSNYGQEENKTQQEWKLTSNLSNYPQYKSNQMILNAIYQLGLEELEKNMAPDTTFNTGEKWQGVWTRDISYSVILALAITHPEVSKNSLLKKVKHGKIIQDTGTGGSWPVSSDRMIWSVAAWEIYKTTGDLDWLKRAYFIIKNSTEDDLNVVWDYQKHLFKGESSFLDWREQSYPKWMEPIDIFNSYSLSTQAVHYQSLQVLIQMGKILGKDVQKYFDISQAVKTSINEKFWLPEKGYFGQFLYGQKYHQLSNRSESLGEALCILWNIADKPRANQIIANTPQNSFGIPCFHPQIPNVAAYHNQAIWPFVQSYWTWASAKAKNIESVNHGLACAIRSTALFLTNKENLLISTGDFNGTAINSDRQLWSVAGSLSTIFRTLLGFNYTAGYLELKPFIPREYKGKQSITNLIYHQAILDIYVYGFGDQVSSFSIDGQYYSRAIIPKDLEGKHVIEIRMNNKQPKNSGIHLTENLTSPEFPNISYANNRLNWNKIEGANTYRVFKNGELLLETPDDYMAEVTLNKPTEFQVQAIDKKGIASFLSKPLYVYPSVFTRSIEAELFSTPQTTKSFVELSKKKNRDFYFKIRIPSDGDYYIDFLYANGNGPINTNNKCGIRSLWLENDFLGALVFPQRGNNNWTDYGYTNAFPVKLEKGNALFKISFEEFNKNMNLDTNSVRIDKIRLIRRNEPKDHSNAS